MKITESIAAAARGLSALALCGVGILAFIVGIVMFFGGFAKDRRSDPDPTWFHIFLGMAIGSVILAAAGACLVQAVRLIKEIPDTSPPDENAR